MGIADDVRGTTRRFDLEAFASVLMALGTAIVLCGLLLVMLREPFEQVDDLIWLNKLRTEDFATLPFSPAWMTKSAFYRPVAELILKLLYASFGLHSAPYRIVQFAALLLLLWCSWLLIRRIGLKTETFFLLAVFVVGSPFISGSVVWLSELPHLIVLICFAIGLAALLSERSASYRLAVCALCFAVALLSKENGLALLIFYPFLVREVPVRATISFGAIGVGYFMMRSLVLGSGLATSAPDEDVGFFFQFLDSQHKHELFPGQAIYQLYAYDIAAQGVALFSRLTKWGAAIKEIEYETPLQIASTVVIIVGAGAWRKHRVICLLLAAVALGGLLFSYAYARDRHLALPAFAYGLLLLVAVDGLRARWRWIVLCVWAAWAIQAALTVRSMHRASVDLVEKVYRPNLTPTNAGLPLDIWTSAREDAIQLR